MFRTAILALLSASFAASAPPATPKKSVTDTYHGVKVTDDYRWLEDWDDKAVKAWSEAQNAHARGVLDQLPGADALRRKLTTIMAAKTTGHSSLAVRGDRVFALRRQPPKEQPVLVVLPAADRPDDAKVLLDPTELDTKGSTSIDWFVPSPDGKRVAVSLSTGGSEAGDVHLYDADTGQPTGEVIPRVNNGTAGGGLAWAADGQGFYYTRYPRGTERPPEDRDFYQQLYFHALGSSAESDRYELGKDLPRIAEIQVQLHAESGRLLATVQNGDGGEFAFFLRSAEGKWQQIAKFEDRLVQAAFGPDGSLYLVSRKDAPRGKIIRLAAGSTDLAKATTVVPEGEDTIVTDFWTAPDEATVLPTAKRLYVTYQLGGPSVLRCFGYDGKPLAGPKQPDVAAVGGLTPAGGDDVLFRAESFGQAGAVYRFRPTAGETKRLPLTSDPPVDLSDVTVVREFATSKDGTKVPVTVLVPKGAKLDGTNPCLLTAYGGYGVSIEPGFHPASRLLFDHGFVLAVANLRGGGEYGEAWHAAGSRTKKQNVFDDFAAVMQHLADRKYTSAGKLAIEGGSNGGLLMGATLTQHPDRLACVVSHVGIYDMLRVELSSNGAFNIPEFGSVKDETQFKALHAYSPYHRVTDGTKYPPTLLLTGANDPRVDPMQSRKFTARLQAAHPDGVVLLRTSAGTGHGHGTGLTDRIAEATDVYAFLFRHLGVEGKR